MVCDNHTFLVDLYSCLEDYDTSIIRLEEENSSRSAIRHGIISLKQVIYINVL